MTRFLGCIAGLTTLLLSAGTLLAAAGGKDANEYVLTGSREALWVLRQRADEYDVVAKPLSKEWSWQARGLTGKPLAAVATDTRLLTFFPGRSVLIHALQSATPTTGPSPADPNWPSDASPAALCATEGIGKHRGSVVAVVRLASDVDKASDRAKAAVDDLARAIDEDGDPDEAAIDRMAGALAEKAAGERLALAEMHEPRLGVFLYTGSEWKLLTSLPCREWRAGEPIYAGSVAGSLQLWLPGCVPSADAVHHPPEADPNATPAVVSFNGNRWTVQLTREQIGRLDPVGMTALENHLVLLGRSARKPADPNTPLTTAPATEPASQPDELSLLAYDVAGGTLTRQTVAPAEGVDLSAAGPLVGVTRLGGLVILAWEPVSPGKPLLLGKLGLDGRIVGTEPLTVLTEPEPSGDAAQVIEIMMGAVLVAMFIPLFILRPRGPQKPFGLPKLYVPGNLLKRLAAGAMDLLPFMLVASAAFGVEPETMDELWEMTKVENLPVEYAYWLVSMLGCYVAYGVVMEYRFGATVGKLITRLRVVGNGGEDPDLRACFLRNIVKIVELVTFLLPLLIVLPIVTPFNQRLGDMLARTTVVEKASIDLARRAETLDVPEQVRPHETDAEHRDTSGDDEHSQE